METLNLDALPELPQFEVTLKQETKKFDALELSFELQKRLGEELENPGKAKEVVKELTGFEVSPFQALVLIKRLIDFTESDELNEPLKKVFGHSLLPTTTSDTPSEPIETNSPLVNEQDS